jgi:hypothetical protein
VGGGYSYPPPFAVAMVPLAALPFGVAVASFTVGSVVVFALTTGWWIARVVARPRWRLLLAAAAGFYPPVAGSVFAGQANLFVVGLLGLGLAPFVPRGARDATDGRPSVGRSFAGGLAIGLGGIVKLAPLALAAPLGLAAIRLRSAAATLGGLALGAVGALVLAAAVAPAASSGAGSLTALLEPDPFWTNQSLNGALSRLFLDGDRTVALVHADPTALIVAATALLGAATLVVLVRTLAAPGRPTPPALAVALALSIVAAAVGAPKDSFWNHAPVLLAVALAVGAGGLAATRGRRILVASWVAASALQPVVDRWLALGVDRPSPLVTVLSDSGTVALLALWLALASLASSIAAEPVRRDPDGA